MESNGNVHLLNYTKNSASGEQELNVSSSSSTTTSGPSLAWRNLRFEVNQPNTGSGGWFKSLFSKEKKIILPCLTGSVNPGSLNGFMGPSGAGKTTLLNCLNGNISQLSPVTELYIGRNVADIPVIGFIEQHVHETIIGGLTVEEVLYYAFRFKNNSRKDFGKHFQQHVTKTMEELMLDPRILKNTFEKCSGGEQKRLAIAQELMSFHKPCYMFIDEPTTGLDSQAALLVMECLRKLVTNHHPLTVLVSIHSPADEIIRLFDQLYILAKGGVCIYAGPPSNLRSNYKRMLREEIPENDPPIEHYLKLACEGINDSAVQKLAQRTLKSQNECLKTYLDGEELRHPPSSSNHMPRQYKSFSFGDLWIQFCRLFYVIMVIDYRKILFKLICYVMFYLYMATVFDRKIITKSNMCFPIVDYDQNITCAEETERHGWANSYVNYQGHSVMFFGALKVLLGSMLFFTILKVFDNEHRNRWYSMSTFYWAFTTIRILEMTLFSLIITFLIYVPIGTYVIDIEKSGNIWNWTRFGSFWWFIWVYSLYLHSTGQLAGLIFTKHLELSVLASVMIYIQYMLVSNYILNLAHMQLHFVNILAEQLGVKYIANGLLYSFFQLDRCDLETEINQKTEDFRINFDTVYTDSWRVLVNTFVLRLIAFILMYVKFSWIPRGSKKSSFTRRLSLKSEIFGKLKQKQQQTVYSLELGLPELDNGNRSRTSSFSSANLSLQTEIAGVHRKKSQLELDFEEFSREKIIIAWQQLNLFRNHSIKETRSLNSQNHDNHKSDDDLILRNLQGHFRFGTMNALMGTSGAGKTSLLKVLNGRSKSRLSNETKIFLSRFTPTRICYLTQEVSGHLWPGLTARQSLIYASKLKNSFETENYVDHELIAEKLLEELDILDTADTLVQNCSGGQRKRLALALELTSVRMPNLICIDEPTSGLDSNSSEVVVQCLKRLVHRNNITIVASIHQPSTELLMLFDYCYVLARGGVCIYFGRPQFISKHLAQVPEIRWSERTEDRFPVQELIKYSCLDYDDTVVQKLIQATEDKLKRFSENIDEDTQLIVDGIQVNRTPFSLYSTYLTISRYGRYVMNYFWPYYLCSYILYIVLAATNRMFYNDKIALTSGCKSLSDDFLNFCNRTQDQMDLEIDLTSNARYTFFTYCCLAMAVMLNSGLTLLMDSTYFFNEHRNGWYSTGVYYLMKSLIDILPTIPVIMLCVFILDIYESVRPGMYWWMSLLYVMALICLQGVSHVLALLSTKVGTANKGQVMTLTIILICYIFLMNMLSNFFNPLSNLHYAYQMISYFNPSRWLYEGLIILQYGFDRCGPKQIQLVLYVMKIEHSEHHFYMCVRMLVFNLILYRTLAMLILMAKANPVKNRRKRAERIREYYHKVLLAKPAINPSVIPGLGHSDTMFFVKNIQI